MSEWQPIETAPKGTNEVAKIVGVAPDVLRKWKARGYLKLAPPGQSGQGRGNECFWSSEAIQEAIHWKRRSRRGRKHPPGAAP